jgi:inosine-uridine nucleoside N-ribohydrolase
MRLILEIETSDPDDVLTLLHAVANPSVQLLAVLLSPGTELQIAAVRLVLEHLFGGPDHGVRIGAFNVNHSTPNGGDCVSGWHFKALRAIGFTAESRASPDADGWSILSDLWSADVVLVTGAPLKNLGAFLRRAPEQCGAWVAQGGFAGANVVPQDLRLPKFGDALFAQTFNFGGDLGSAELALSYAALQGRTTCVSKNLCHRVMFTAERLAQLGARLTAPFASDVQRRALTLVHDGMAIYLAKKSQGKAFHDPLALAAALAPDLFVWAPVRVVRGPRSTFGCETLPDGVAAPHRISIDCNEDAVFSLLFCNTDRFQR